MEQFVNKHLANRGIGTRGARVAGAPLLKNRRGAQHPLLLMQKLSNVKPIFPSDCTTIDLENSKIQIFWGEGSIPPDPPR